MNQASLGWEPIPQERRKEHAQQDKAYQRHV